jgi:hypothetical protein
MKTPVLRLIMLFSLAALAFAGCNQESPGGGIPIDRERAKTHIITEKQARALIGRYKESRLRVNDTTNFLRDTSSLPHAESFNRHAIALLLNQEGAEGIRIYFGRDEKGEVHLVLLPIDKDGKNIVRRLLGGRQAYIPGVKSANAQYEDGDGEAVENGQRCPHDCDESW